MATQEERRKATRSKLITAARDCFFREGYEGTHTGDIIDQAGISRGAMYHHFPSKKDVFEAVFVTVSDEAIKLAAKQGSQGKSPLDDLLAACLTWLQAVRKPDVAVILLEQGPQVLGWKRARELEANSSLTLMKQSLKRAIDAGEASVPSIELTARLINAVLGEAALTALYREPRVSVAKQEASIRQFINALRVQ